MAAESQRRKQRLHELITLARCSRRWSRVQLARALHRDASRLYPDGVNPKLDFLMGLAETLGWPLGAVVEYIWSGTPCENPDELPPPASDDFDELLDAAREAFRHGRYQETIVLARRMQRVARTPAERGLALSKEASALSSEGCVDRALAVGRRSLTPGPIPRDVLLASQLNYADTLIDARQLAPALGIAERTLAWFGEHRPESASGQMVRAFAHYLRGRASLGLASLEPELREQHAERAAAAMRTSREMHQRIAATLDRPELEAIADTSRVAILAAEVELGRVAAENVVAEIIDALPTTFDEPRFALGDWLECCGWWCVFGARLALRHMEGKPRSLALAILNNKILDIADRADNWFFRQQVLRIRYEAHRRMLTRTGLRVDWTLDDDDVRMVVGVMGRCSGFRDIGWRMLRDAGRTAC